ncbi:sensor histidine kinase [Chryseolinea lacunae]|uniref:histidine kinase n=1 Tax=Chryseolinea lacunae TaxID=2801331 RepID=A0ABS1KXD1_9BACT|nr:HAMP domain-containing sensor histidine kinase [Chryseolinea lacunae]MBL0743990.1 HAMP domain-containing histidine kinase [Chryseolinea lacunae]
MSQSFRPLHLLKRLAWWGTSAVRPDWQNRSIINTNGTACILAAVIGLLAVLIMVTHPFEPVFWILFSISAVSTAVPVLNKFGYTILSRHLLTLNVMVGAMVFTVARKLMSEHTAALFYQPRAGFLVMAIIPLIVFHFREWRQLVISMLPGLLALLLFDPIHNLFGVGYYQMGFTDPDYYFTNVVFFCYYIFLMGGVAFLKTMMERYEKRNHDLIRTLNKVNIQTIKQNKELESKSYLLSELLDKKDDDLADITQELARYNHELLQYSYTISHNLRGPVASIMGLLELRKMDDLEITSMELLDNIEKSTETLDLTIRDLNRIVDERQNKFNIRETVMFEHEVNRIVSLLEDHIRDHRVVIRKDFNRAPSVFSVQARVHYVLFSLISNAIQYRALDRPTEIKVRSYPEQNGTVVEVSDNGVGINMGRYGDKLFKPFQRFHPHASGKGLSLYLVKLHVEKMSGSVHAESSPDVGTTFRIFFQHASPAIE